MLVPPFLTEGKREPLEPDAMMIIPLSSVTVRLLHMGENNLEEKPGRIWTEN